MENSQLNSIEMSRLDKRKSQIVSRLRSNSRVAPIEHQYVFTKTYSRFFYSNFPADTQKLQNHHQ